MMMMMVARRWSLVAGAALILTLSLIRTAGAQDSTAVADSLVGDSMAVDTLALDSFVVERPAVDTVWLERPPMTVTTVTEPIPGWLLGLSGGVLALLAAALGAFSYARLRPALPPPATSDQRPATQTLELEVKRLKTALTEQEHQLAEHKHRLAEYQLAVQSRAEALHEVEVARRYLQRLLLTLFSQQRDSNLTTSLGFVVQYTLGQWTRAVLNDEPERQHAMLTNLSHLADRLQGYNTESLRDHLDRLFPEAERAAWSTRTADRRPEDPHEGAPLFQQTLHHLARHSLDLMPFYYDLDRDGAVYRVG